MVQSDWGSLAELTDRADAEQRHAVLERKALPSATPPVIQHTRNPNQT